MSIKTYPATPSTRDIGLVFLGNMQNLGDERRVGEVDLVAEAETYRAAAPLTSARTGAHGESAFLRLAELVGGPPPGPD